VFFFFFNYIRRSFLQLSIDFCLNRLRINGVEGACMPFPAQDLKIRAAAWAAAPKSCFSDEFIC